MGRVEGKVAVITGGSRGIGRSICDLFAREGAKIVFCGRDIEAGERTRRDLAANASDAVFVQADVTVKEQVTAVVQSALERFGGVDILVNNAQILADRVPLSEKTDAEYERTLRSGLYATLWAMQAVFSSMRERGGGRIVNFSSFAGTIGMKYISDYGATKEAIGALTRAAAQEWGRHGILVNAVKPAAATQESTKAIANAIGGTFPLRRMAGPEEVACAVLGLVSERCRFVTGQTIYVDGGQHLMVPRLDLDRGLNPPSVLAASDLRQP
jgi:NAD(P)-dependent dehydrogenase (short-subunit alcohol dehydrogenase family)